LCEIYRIIIVPDGYEMSIMVLNYNGFNMW